MKPHFIYDLKDELRHHLKRGDVIMSKSDLAALFPNDPERRPDYFTTITLNQNLSDLVKAYLPPRYPSTVSGKLPGRAPGIIVNSIDDKRVLIENLTIG
jgi:hypothetical protein